MKTQHCRRLDQFLAMVAVAWLAGCWPAAAEAPQENTALYSGLCFSKITGDVNRDRLMLLHVFGQYYVVFQSGLGVLTPPTMTQAKVVGDDISFELKPSDGRPASFSGTIMPREIVGQFADRRTSDEAGSTTFRWPRKALDDMTLPPCYEGPYPVPDSGQK
jgi:hypothetical protein